MSIKRFTRSTKAYYLCGNFVHIWKNTLDLSSALVFVSPKCPASIKFTARFR